MRRTIRLTESDLHRIVKRVINEYNELPKGSKVSDDGNRVSTQNGRSFNLDKGKRKFNLEKGCEVQPNGTKVRDNGDVATPSGRKFNLNKESLNRIVSESIRRVLNEWDLL